MVKVDIRSKHSAYITIGKWVIYADNSTGEYIIDSWKEAASAKPPDTCDKSRKRQASSI